MAYERQTWETGTVIPESKLLHIENGIYDVTETADQAATDVEQNKKNISQNMSDIEQNSADIATLNSALADCYTSFGFGSVTTTSVTFESSTRATINSFAYPSAMTSHDFAFPISADSGNGYIQGSLTGVYKNNCSMMFQDARGSSTSTITPTLYFIYADK